jgi:hypothetical protein
LPSQETLLYIRFSLSESRLLICRFIRGSFAAIILGELKRRNVIRIRILIKDLVKDLVKGLVKDLVKGKVIRRNKKTVL